MSLTQDQIQVKNSIIAYGQNNGYSSEQIQIAINVAFIESSLGQNLSNPSSTASGLFQYLDGTWNTYHSNIGIKNDHANQTTAFFNDLQTYHNWFSNPATNGNIPSNLTLEEYAYIKHHDGRSYSDFDNAPGKPIYNDALTEAIIGLLDFSWIPPEGGQGRSLCVDKDLYLGGGEAIALDPVDCIKYANPGDPSSIYIDYSAEGDLTHSQRQDIIDADPSNAFYFCDR